MQLLMILILNGDENDNGRESFYGIYQDVLTMKKVLIRESGFRNPYFPFVE